MYYIPTNLESKLKPGADLNLWDTRTIRELTQENYTDTCEAILQLDRIEADLLSRKACYQDYRPVIAKIQEMRVQILEGLIQFPSFNFRRTKNTHPAHYKIGARMDNLETLEQDRQKKCDVERVKAKETWKRAKRISKLRPKAKVKREKITIKGLAEDIFSLALWSTVAVIGLIGVPTGILFFLLIPETIQNSFIIGLVTAPAYAYAGTMILGVSLILIAPVVTGPWLLLELIFPSGNKGSLENYMNYRAGKIK